MANIQIISDKVTKGRLTSYLDILSVAYPATENTVTIINASISDLNAMVAVVCSSSPLVMLINIGTFAMGFIIAKNPINTVTAWSSMFFILYLTPSQRPGCGITTKTTYSF